MNELRVIAITHKNFPLETIGRFHIEPSLRKEKLTKIKALVDCGELMYLSTCNRIEIIFSFPHFVCPGLASTILREIQPELSENALKEIVANVECYSGQEALLHLLNVSSGVDSMIIGEREIITQIRKAYEECFSWELTGDALRLVISQCVKTAKEIFTNTDLAKKPVSVVSLAWQQFTRFGIKQNDRILLIGSGQIIRNFTKFLFEHGYKNLTIASRTFEHARELAQSINGKAIVLDELDHFTEGFDALISCTAADHAVISREKYLSILRNEASQKLIIDLALPADIDHSIIENHNVNYVDMNQIQLLASQNIQFREQALQDCIPIINEGLNEFEISWQSRQIEYAMRSIPAAIKDIRNTALGSVFARDLETLDDEAKELLEKIMNYMEKKYISIPMKMAKEVLLNKVRNN